MAVGPSFHLTVGWGFWGLESRRGTSLFGGPRFICCCLLNSAGINPPWNASTVPALDSLKDPKISGGTASRSVRVAHKKNNYRGVSYSSSHTSPLHWIESFAGLHQGRGQTVAWVAEPVLVGVGFPGGVRG